MQTSAQQVVFTNKARCRDCYRCLRVCPVKAIRMQDGQAHVDAERCIACGTCIRECPQQAKSYRNDLERARRLIASGQPVAASVAPSFVARWPDWRGKRLASALRKLGFAHVAETAAGALQVARRTAELVSAQPSRPHVCTACPAAVRYVERYMPELSDRLTPVASPMVVHARMLKGQLGQDARVVFIGPCVAKKAEAQRPELAGAVDCVLTFEELDDWLAEESVDLAGLEESDFDPAQGGLARVFPLVGGSIRTAGLTSDMLAQDVLSASGFEDVRAALEAIVEGDQAQVVEPLLCPQGCINGPALGGQANLYVRRRRVLDYAVAPAVTPIQQPQPPCDRLLEARFAPAGAALDDPRVTEDRIRQVLEQTGKADPQDQLNCGACGYLSCRDKAIAVLLGMAEPEMCIPRMRRLAEQRTDRIIETSPNGIVILDERLCVIHMNPAFKRCFLASEAVLGKPISYLMDPDPFERLAAGGEDLVEMTARHERYNLVCHQILYPLREQKQFVGIFVNVTRSAVSQAKLTELREQTVMQARELLNHQMDMAQRIAQFLGESTAQGEVLVENLMKLARQDQAATDKPKRTPWNTATSK